MTLIEAFAAGTPVIASALGAMRSMVHEGHNGWLFPPNNAIALRQKVTEWLHTDNTYRAAVSRQAQNEYLQHYTAERNKNHLLTCYQAAKGAAL